MDVFQIIAALITVSALFAYANYRWLRLPTTIGLMAMTLVFSLALIAACRLFPSVGAQVVAIVGRIDFNRTLLNGMLGFLLFAGALHLELNDLTGRKLLVATLATASVLISTLLVGMLAWWLLPLLGLELRFIYCLLLGALISPTDPIAVLGMLKRVGAPKDVEVTIAGESLFNDGFGVAVFLAVLGIATEGGSSGPGLLAAAFLKEAVGGAVFGLAVGLLAYLLLRSVDNYPVEILLSLAVAAGGYASADALRVSAPITVVVAGLLIGNHGRAFAMSPRTVERLDLFWELVDEFLNAVLFVLLGLEVLALTITTRYLAAGLLLIPVTLLARWASVGLPVTLLRRWQPIGRNMVWLLTWGGLRGGISVALALSLRERATWGGESQRELILTITYVVVVFSILVQGMTVGPLIRRLLKTPDVAKLNTPHPPT
jgi:CPA1 family monovalent cation:H+ antiporter